MEERLVAALKPLAAAFQDLRIAYFVGGSVANSAHGIPRTTIDVDLIVDLRPADVHALVNALGDSYYVSAEAVEDAVQRRSSFNLIHHDTMIKADVFVLKNSAYDAEAFRRARAEQNVKFPFIIAQPEDVVLHKLLGYRMGDEVSERQWLDVMGVLKVQGENLDHATWRSGPMSWR